MSIKVFTFKRKKYLTVCQFSRVCLNDGTLLQQQCGLTPLTIIKGGTNPENLLLGLMAFTGNQDNIIVGSFEY